MSRENRKALPGHVPGTPWEPEEWAAFKKQALGLGAVSREEGTPTEYLAWFSNFDLHREDGPAYVEIDGTEWWCQNGKRHRLDGPALTHRNGFQEWWKEGMRYTDGTFTEEVVEITFD